MMLAIIALALAIPLTTQVNKASSPVSVKGLQVIEVVARGYRASPSVVVESGLKIIEKSLHRYLENIRTPASATNLFLYLYRVSARGPRALEVANSNFLTLSYVLRETPLNHALSVSSSLSELAYKVNTLRTMLRNPVSSSIASLSFAITSWSLLERVEGISIAPSKYVKGGAICAGINYSITSTIIDTLGGIYNLRVVALEIDLGNKSIQATCVPNHGCSCNSSLGSCRAELTGNELYARISLSTYIPWNSSRVSIRVVAVDRLGGLATKVRTFKVVNEVNAEIKLNSTIFVTGAPMEVSVKAWYRDVGAPVPNDTVYINGSALCRTNASGIAQCILRAPRKPGNYTLVVSLAHGPSKTFAIRVLEPSKALSMRVTVWGYYMKKRITGAGHVIHVEVRIHHALPLRLLLLRMDSSSPLLEATYFFSNDTLVQKGIAKVVDIHRWDRGSDTTLSIGVSIPWSVNGTHTLMVKALAPGVAKNYSETIEIVNETRIVRYALSETPLTANENALLSIFVAYFNTSIPAGGETITVNGTRIVANTDGVAYYSFKAPSKPGKYVLIVDPAHGPPITVPLIVAPPIARGYAVSILGGIAQTLTLYLAALLASMLALAALTLTATRRVLARRIPREHSR